MKGDGFWELETRLIPRVLIFFNNVDSSTWCVASGMNPVLLGNRETA